MLQDNEVKSIYSEWSSKLSETNYYSSFKNTTDKNDYVDGTFVSLNNNKVATSVDGVFWEAGSVNDNPLSRTLTHLQTFKRKYLTTEYPNAPQVLDGSSNYLAGTNHVSDFKLMGAGNVGAWGQNAHTNIINDGNRLVIKRGIPYTRGTQNCYYHNDGFPTTDSWVVYSGSTTLSASSGKMSATGTSFDIQRYGNVSNMPNYTVSIYSSQDADITIYLQDSARGNEQSRTVSIPAGVRRAISLLPTSYAGGYFYIGIRVSAAVSTTINIYYAFARNYPTIAFATLDWKKDDIDRWSGGYYGQSFSVEASDNNTLLLKEGINGDQFIERWFDTSGGQKMELIPGSLYKTVYIKFRRISGTGGSQISMSAYSFTRGNVGFKSIALSGNDDWQVATFDMSDMPLWVDNDDINFLRFDIGNSSAVYKNLAFEVDYIAVARSVNSDTYIYFNGLKPFNSNTRMVSFKIYGDADEADNGDHYNIGLVLNNGSYYGKSFAIKKEPTINTIRLNDIPAWVSNKSSTMLRFDLRGTLPGDFKNNVYIEWVYAGDGSWTDYIPDETESESQPATALTAPIMDNMDYSMGTFQWKMPKTETLNYNKYYHSLKFGPTVTFNQAATVSQTIPAVPGAISYFGCFYNNGDAVFNDGVGFRFIQIYYLNSAKTTILQNHAYVFNNNGPGWINAYLKSAAAPANTAYVRFTIGQYFSSTNQIQTSGNWYVGAIHGWTDNTSAVNGTEIRDRTFESRTFDNTDTTGWVVSTYNKPEIVMDPYHHIPFSADNVRQNGWVMKINQDDGATNSNYIVSTGTIITSGFTPGTSTMKLGLFAKKDSSLAFSSGGTGRVQVECYNSSNAQIGQFGISLGTSLATTYGSEKTTTGSVPVGTTYIKLIIYAYKQTAGTIYLGPIAIWLDDKITYYNDWADGPTSSVLNLKKFLNIEYDPVNAYLGNSYNGQAGTFTYVVWPSGAGVFNNIHKSIVPGEDYTAYTWAKSYYATENINIRIRRLSGPNGSYSINAASTVFDSATDTSWVQKSVRIRSTDYDYNTDNQISWVDINRSQSTAYGGLWFFGPWSVTSASYGSPRKKLYINGTAFEKNGAISLDKNNTDMFMNLYNIDKEMTVSFGFKPRIMDTTTKIIWSTNEDQNSTGAIYVTHGEGGSSRVIFRLHVLSGLYCAYYFDNVITDVNKTYKMIFIINTKNEQEPLVVYVDGKKIDLIQYSNYIGSTSVPLLNSIISFGGWLSNTSGNNSGGEYSDIRVYNRVINKTEIFFISNDYNTNQKFKWNQLDNNYYTPGYGYKNGKYYAVASGGVYTSDDLLSWTNRNISNMTSSGDIQMVITPSGDYIATVAGKLYKSNNMLSQNLVSPNGFTQLVKNKSGVYSIDNNSVVYHSINGNDWSTKYTANANRLNRLLNVTSIKEKVPQLFDYYASSAYQSLSDTIKNKAITLNMDMPIDFYCGCKTYTANAFGYDSSSSSYYLSFSDPTTTDWTISTDASIVYDPANAYSDKKPTRKRGYVGKIQRTSGSGTCVIQTPVFSSGFTPGVSTLQVKAVAKVSTDFMDDDSQLRIRAVAQNSATATLATSTMFVSEKSYTYKAGDVVTIPVGTTRIVLQAYSANQTAGVAYAGWLELWIDGLLVKTYDMSDTTGWTIDTDASVVYDQFAACDDFLIYDQSNSYISGSLVRQNGYVGKIQRKNGVGRCDLATSTGLTGGITSGFTPGVSKAQVKALARISSDFADDDGKFFVTFDSFDVSGNYVNSTGIMESSQLWSVTQTTPQIIGATATRLRARVYTNLQTAGTVFVGWLGLWIDDVLVKIWDFSDQSAYSVIPGEKIDFISNHPNVKQPISLTVKSVSITGTEYRVYVNETNYGSYLMYANAGTATFYHNSIKMSDDVIPSGRQDVDYIEISKKNMYGDAL